MPPIPQTGTLSSADSSVQLFTHSWSPESPRAVVVVVHGYAEHGGRHARLAERYAAEGYAVFAFDQRGFGQSGGRQGYVGCIDEYVEDVGLALTWARQTWPGIPVYLHGHSMGGAIAILAALKRPADLDGLILSSPMLRTYESPVLQRIAGVMGTLIPWLPTVPLDRTKLSRLSSVVDEADHDPHCYHGRIQARTGREFIRAMRRIQKGGHELECPFLIIHGTADEITDPAASGDLYARARSTDKQLGLFEGLAHETINEPEGDQVLDTLISWLDEHTDGEDA